MTDNTPTTLTCPSCGAPLEVDGKSALVRCKFCKNTAFVPGVASAQGTPPHLALDEIRRLAQNGNVVEAIRQYRALYDVSLKEAKDAVDALVSGKVAAERRVPSTRPPSAEDTSRVLEEVKEFLRRGEKIEAIKRYREVHDVSLAQAKEAIDQIEAGFTGIPVPPRPVSSGTSATYAPTTYSTSSKPSRAGCGALAVIFVVLLVGGILGLVFFSPGGPLVDLLISNGPAMLIPSAAGSPDVAAAFYNSNDETHVLGMVTSADGKLVWRTEPLPGENYFDALAQDGENVYAASETDLFAYRLTDGSQAWHSVMPDRLNYTEASLAVVGRRVIVSSVDQSVRAYDTVTGELVWERLLSGYDRTLRLMGDSLVVVDYVGDSYDFGLIFLDPQTGVEQRVLTPGCKQDEYTTIFPEPDAPLLYQAEDNTAIFISSDYSGCIQRFDIFTGEPVWETIPETSFSLSSWDVPVLETGDAVYFTTYTGICRVERSTGSLQVLVTNEDYDFVPLLLHGDTLLVRARRTRGTEKFELWGVDPSSGALLWQMDMTNAKPLDPPNELVSLVDEDESGWTWNLVASQLVLVKFQANPHQLIIQNIDLTNGTLSSELTVELKSVSGDFYSVPGLIGWDGTRFYFSLDGKIYSVDVSTGEIIFKYQ